MADRILILGASARAAAASARRAGLTPFAVDLFADADTKRICERVWRCPPDRYPHGLFALAKHAPPMPWMYTGGLENYPELVGELARERKLWGNGPASLAVVRDPFRLSGQLSRWCHGIPHPVVQPAGSPVTEPDRWLRKPLRGSGGFGIRFARPDDPASQDHFYQQFVNGRSLSALFRSEGDAVHGLGTTGQLVGLSWLHAPRFRYCGNVYPAGNNLPDLNELMFAALNLVRHLNVSGPFGIDFVADEEQLSLIEINPRYTASLEVIEFATGRSSLTGSIEGSAHPSKPCVGKAIYYTPHRVTFPASGPWDDSLALATDVWHRPDFADIPHPGDMIEPGQPVITLMTDAETEANCLARLQSRAAELDRLFGFSPTAEDAPCPR